MAIITPTFRRAGANLYTVVLLPVGCSLLRLRSSLCSCVPTGGSTSSINFHVSVQMAPSTDNSTTLKAAILVVMSTPSHDVNTLAGQPLYW